jgi:hypothetical protein
MRTILITITALVGFPILAEENGGLGPIGAPVENRTTGIYSQVPSINLTTAQTVSDAVKQIIEGLPPEGRGSFVVDVPESELTKMQMKKDLRLRNVPLPVLLKHLGEASPVGYRLWNNEWHISNQRSDDLIAVKYWVSEADLEQLGIVIGKGQTFTTTSGKTWPPESESSASFVPRSPDTKTNPETGTPSDRAETMVLRLYAARSYHEEFSAVLLLKSKGYEKLSLER